jgi:hypothetical protein
MSIAYRAIRSTLNSRPVVFIKCDLDPAIANGQTRMQIAELTTSVLGLRAINDKRLIA